MNENNSSETTFDTNEKQLNRVKEFLDKFIVEGENNPHSSDILARGHVIWKENLRQLPKKETKGKDDDNAFEFYSTQFEFTTDFAVSIANTIDEKLKRLIELDEQKFKVNQKLTHGSYGYENDWRYDVLAAYFKSMKASTSKDKLNIVNCLIFIFRSK